MTPTPSTQATQAALPAVPASAAVPGCRFCRAPLTRTFVDLGSSPPSNRLLTADQLEAMEPFHPLRAYVCGSCFLVQLREQLSPAELFGADAHFSSSSDSWLAHAESFVDLAIERFGLSGRSRVVELASNDGYLLQFFVRRGVPVLGVEPAANVAEVAQRRGIPTLVRFFGVAAAEEVVRGHGQADLLVGNNVLAHVPDLNDFVAGMRDVLAPTGVITMEFPHLLRLMADNQFDTIHHEHFSYFSFTTAERVFGAHGLTIFDVEELPTQGGSLRVFARHAGATGRPVLPRVHELRGRELAQGVLDLETYRSFERRVHATKRRLLQRLIAARDAGRSIAAYGAPVKGNTLLNYCGIRTDLIDYTVDRSPHKQGKFLPGSRIPVHAPERLRETRPDLVLILPWNLGEEVMGQLGFVRAWGGRFVVPIPDVQVL